MTSSEKQAVYIAKKQSENPYFWDMYRQLIEHETFSPEELQRWNFKRRLDLLNYAYEHTKFYKDLYDKSGIHPHDIKDEKDWGQLPIVTKQMLKEHLDEMCVDEKKSQFFKRYAVKGVSGGSTGNPVKFFIDRHENGSSYNFAEIRAYGWWLGREHGQLLGKEALLGQNEAWIERVSIVYPLLRSNAVRDAIAKSMWPQKRFYLDIMEMDAQKIKVFTDEVNREGVFYVAGYTGALEEVAKYYLSGTIARQFVPRAISSRATPLTPISRRIIEDGFGCPVFDIYGSNESYHIAVECPCAKNHSLHVLSDLRYVDVVGDDGKNRPIGEEGTVVVTDFMNHVMPLIRYSLGDRTSFVAERCSCGLPFPLIRPVQGRESDYVEAYDGTRINGLCCAFDLYPDCADRYQFVQHAPGKVTIRVVPNRMYSQYDRDCHKAMEDLQKAAAGRVDYDLQYVDEIPHDGGKIRFIVYE